MFYHDLDDLPTQYPEHLVLISESDFNQLKQTKKQGEFLLADDKHYLVIPSEHEAQKHPITKALLEKSQLQPNTLLMLNKYANENEVERYLPYDVVAKKTLEFQMLQFTELCQHLGAKSVRLIYESNRTKETNTSTQMNGNIKGANASMGANHQSDTTNNNQTEATTIFDGKHINLAQAKSLMDTGIFEGNPQVIAFYNTAKNQTNKMQKQTIKFTASQQLSKQLKLFANADVPFLKSIANAEFTRTVTEVESWRVEYEVEF